jgi:hypothetical protein
MTEDQQQRIDRLALRFGCVEDWTVTELAEDGTVSVQMGVEKGRPTEFTVDEHGRVRSHG